MISEIEQQKRVGKLYFWLLVSGEIHLLGRNVENRIVYQNAAE